ncbi:uncharacterized protein PHALS_05570 [Plasmopara halstedii]|uniref:Uncharacterized protein n=1 Tax=Plasmopara halstedii TaxID=4781 RepID=A0A0P1B1W0_PLAHL|nr:uncharacterized protein PHALS_05570 [Plasmopara halstedii]CEG48096.1 hypothetical protein PHALS_05570 [Plasmopara halstedii]|eukprot:XP_024584465.1 hypothetical protein PHALS_05570 [Plasmopara halstedii]
MNYDASHLSAEQRPVIDEPMNSVEKPIQEIKMDEVESGSKIILKQSLSLRYWISNWQELREYHILRKAEGNRLMFLSDAERMKAKIHRIRSTQGSMKMENLRMRQQLAGLPSFQTHTLKQLKVIKQWHGEQQ